MSEYSDTMEVGDTVYFQGKFRKIINAGVKTVDLEDEENPEKAASFVFKGDCITLECYWNGDAKSDSGIQY